MKFCLITIFFITVATGFTLGQSKSYALLVGMDTYDAKAYDRQYDPLGTAGVGNDISVIRSILSRSTHEIIELRSEEATQKKIVASIEAIGKKVRSGDQFLFYYSGHGDTIRDRSGDERSKFDQVLVAYDKYLVDDQIYVLFKKYFTKTKNVMIVDACHSGSSYKIAAFFMDFKKLADKRFTFAHEEQAVRMEKLNSNCDYREKIDEPFDLIYFGATPDDKLSQGNFNGGLLTFYLGVIFRDAIDEDAWETYDYRKLACELQNKMHFDRQDLQYHEIGSAAKNFGKQIPFKSY